MRAAGAVPSSPARTRSPSLVLALLGAAARRRRAAASSPSPRRRHRARPARRPASSTPSSTRTGAAGDGRLLLRFDGYVTNVGKGPLESRATRGRAVSSSSGVAGPADPSVAPDAARGAFERTTRTTTSTSRGRWGTRSGTRRGPPRSPRARRSASASTTSRTPASLPPPAVRGPLHAASTALLRAGEPGLDEPAHGRWSGWRDVYGKRLAFQWVDVSATSAPARTSWRAPPTRAKTVWEGGTTAAETNPRTFADQQVTVPGYVAKPETV